MDVSAAAHFAAIAGVVPRDGAAGRSCAAVSRTRKRRSQELEAEVKALPAGSAERYEAAPARVRGAIDSMFCASGCSACEEAESNLELVAVRAGAARGADQADPRGCGRDEERERGQRADRRERGAPERDEQMAVGDGSIPRSRGRSADGGRRGSALKRSKVRRRCPPAARDVVRPQQRARERQS